MNKMHDDNLTYVEGLPVDKFTGEIRRYKITQSIYDLPYDYPLASDSRFRKRSLLVEGYCLSPDNNIGEQIGAEATEGTDVTSNRAVLATAPTTNAKRGPKPKITTNLLARHVQVAHDEKSMWLDDIVYGACHTTGGVSNGKLNISPRDVLHVCMLFTIETEGVQSTITNHDLRPISLRQARRIAQAARFALGGIKHYLERNPEAESLIRYEIEFADSFVPCLCTTAAA